MYSADQVNSLLDRKQADKLKNTVHALYDKKVQAIICALRLVRWLCKEQIVTMKYSSLLDLLKLQVCPNIENLYSGDNASYQSDRAVEEFQDAICRVIDKDLKEKVSSSNIVSLMYDESDDITVNKKLVVLARFIPKELIFC